MTGMPLGPNPPRKYYNGAIDEKKPRQALAEARDLLYFRRRWFLSMWRPWVAVGGGRSGPGLALADIVAWARPAGVPIETVVGRAPPFQQ